MENCEKSRTERRIILPSKVCLKKCLCHHYGSKLANGEMNWDKIIKAIKKRFELLKETDLVNRKQIKKLYFQRQKEIAKEEQ